MSVLLQNIVSIFEEANRGFLREQKEFILSNVSERSMCGELTKYLIKVISKIDLANYHVDIEYNRNNGKIKTIMDSEERIINIICDIIVHSRGKNVKQDNLIAIEMKKSSQSRNSKNKDRDRLIALTKDTFDDVWSYDGTTLPEHVCRYVVGIFYEVNIESRIVEIEYYVKGKITHKYKVGF